MLSMYE